MLKNVIILTITQFALELQCIINQFLLVVCISQRQNIPNEELVLNKIRSEP